MVSHETKWEKRSGGEHPAGCSRRRQLLSKEDREEHDTFDQSGQNDRQSQDVTSGARIAAGGFSCFRAEQTNADSGTDGCKSYVEIAGQFSEDRKCGHVCRLVGCWFSVSHGLVHGRNGKGSVVLVTFLIVMLANELEEDGGEQCEDERLDESDEELHEIEGKWWQPGGIPTAGDGCHRF